LQKIEVPGTDIGSRFHALIELRLEALQLPNQVKQGAGIIGAIGSDLDHGPRNLPPGTDEIKRWTNSKPDVSLVAMTLLRLATLLLCLAVLGGCACAPGAMRQAPSFESTFKTGA
jgi:hypothetical protein